MKNKYYFILIVTLFLPFCISSAEQVKPEAVALSKQLEGLVVEVNSQAGPFIKAITLVEKYNLQNTHGYFYAWYNEKIRTFDNTCDKIQEDLKKQDCMKAANDLWDIKAKDCLSKKIVSESSICLVKINKERNTKLASNGDIYEREFARIPLSEAIASCSDIKSPEDEEICYLSVAGIAARAAFVENGKIKWNLFEHRWSQMRTEYCKLPINDSNIFKVCLYGHAVTFADNDGRPIKINGVTISADESISKDPLFKKIFCEYSQHHVIPNSNFYSLRNKYCKEKSQTSFFTPKFESCEKTIIHDVVQSKSDMIAKCNLLSGDPVEQLRGVEMLLKNTSPESTKIIRDYLSTFPALNDKAAGLAIHELIQLGDPEIEKILIRMLKQFDRPGAITVALEGVSKLKDVERARDILEKYQEVDKIGIIQPKLNELRQKEYSYEQAWKDPSDPLKFKFHRKTYSLEFQNNILTAKSDSALINGIKNVRISHYSQWTFYVDKLADGFEITFNEKLNVIMERKNNTDAGGPFLVSVSPDSKFIVFDYGTGPGPRGIDIRDEKGNIVMSEASYIGEFSWNKNGFEYGRPSELPLELNEETKKCSDAGAAWEVFTYLFDGKESKKIGKRPGVTCSD